MGGIALYGEPLIPISSLFSPAFSCKYGKKYLQFVIKETASHKLSSDPSFPFATRTAAAKLPANPSDSADLRKDVISFLLAFFFLLLSSTSQE